MGPETREDSPPSLGPPSSRSLLWESVLRRSLQSGDQDRLEAAISLAEDGGASEEVLAAAREQLRRIATASLARAREGSSDPSALSAAIDRADELRADADELQESRKALRRLAHSRLQSALRNGDIAELEAALRLVAVAGAPDAALVASAQRKLRELIEPVAPAGAGEHCVLEVAVEHECSEDEDRKASRRGFFSLGAPRPGKLGGEWDLPQASFVPPMVIGRQEGGDAMMLEAGLRKQHHRVVPSAPQRADLRKQVAARDANAQECTVQ